MTDIVNKCEEAYSLIQNCQNNDSALVEEKAKISRLVDEVSALMGKCELEPAETDNLTYYFEYDIAYTLENTIGEIRLLKPGQKGWFTCRCVGCTLVIIIISGLTGMWRVRSLTPVKNSDFL